MFMQLALNHKTSTAAIMADKEGKQNNYAQIGKTITSFEPVKVTSN